MTLIDVTLWLIFVGIIVIVPIGCIVQQRAKRKDLTKTAG